MGVGHLLRPLGHGSHHRDLVHLLKIVHQAEPQRGRRAECDDRAGIRLRVRESGNHVGRSGGMRRQDHAGLARDARIAMRHHAGRGLVASQDRLHAEIDAVRDDRRREQIEDGIDALAL